MTWKGLLFLVSLSIASPAFAQVVSDPVAEKSLGAKDSRQAETTFFSDWADERDALDELSRFTATSGKELAEKLSAATLCGKDQDADPDAEVRSVCALHVDLYEDPDGFWVANVTPVFGLGGVKSISRLSDMKASTALVPGKRKLPVMTKFADLLPKNDGKKVSIAGSPALYTYSLSFVVGKKQNIEEGLGIPEFYFDHRHYLAINNR